MEHSRCPSRQGKGSCYALLRDHAESDDSSLGPPRGALGVGVRGHAEFETVNGDLKFTCREDADGIHRPRGVARQGAGRT